MQRPYALSCHCGNIRLEVDAELKDLGECNCSTCRRFGFIHWKVPRDAIQMLDEKRNLSTYAWQCVRCLWHFCPTCGTTILCTGYPGGIISVNARCIDYVDVFEFSVARYDGRNLMMPGPITREPIVQR